MDRPGCRTPGVSGPGRIVRSSVRNTTSNSALTSNGFITTRYASSPSPVAASGISQVGCGALTHRSAATPPVFVWVTAVAATQPPKNSTSVEASVDRAGTVRKTWLDASTVNVVPVDDPEPSNDVMRTVEDAGPGLATTIQACHPFPPPCGQNHAPVAGPATGALADRTPTRVSHHPEVVTSPTITTTARSRRPTRV